MEHTFESAFVTRLPSESSSSSNHLASAKPKLSQDKDRTNKIEEIHTQQRKAVQYMEYLSSCGAEIMEKALQNLCLTSGALKLNLIEISASISHKEIDDHHNYITQAVSKLNSLGKEIRKIIKRNAMENGRKASLSRSSNVDLGRINNKGPVQTMNKTINEKMFRHLNLLYKQTLIEELKRREGEQYLEALNDRTLQNIHAEQSKRKQDKQKKMDQNFNKRKTAEEAKLKSIHKQKEQLKGMTRNSESQLPKRAFTKLINHSIEVGSTRKKLENQMHTYLDELRDALEERHSVSKFSKRSGMSREKEEMIRRVQLKKVEQDTKRSEYYLNKWVQKRIYMDSIGCSPANKSVVPKENESVEQSVSYQMDQSKRTEFVLSKPLKKSMSENNSEFNKSNILKEVSLNLRKRQGASRDRFQKNRREKQDQEEVRIDAINKRYLETIDKIQTAYESKRRHHDTQIHNNFKVRERQDQLQSQLRNLAKASERQLKQRLEILQENDVEDF